MSDSTVAVPGLTADFHVLVCSGQETPLSSLDFMQSRNFNLLQCPSSLSSKPLILKQCREAQGGCQIVFRQHGQSLSLVHCLQSWHHECKVFSMECLSKKTHFPDAAAQMKSVVVGEEG